MQEQIIRAPILNPRPDGTVEFLPDGLLVADTRGQLTFVGTWQTWKAQGGGQTGGVTHCKTLLLPPFLDAHTHVSQHPIRGRFTEGLENNPPEGPLLAGLARNVFPAEARAADTDYAAQVVQQFAEDTLAHGVVGGAAWMTVHSGATRAALAALPDAWSVGLVLMNQNCPHYLRTDEDALERDVQRLAADFGPRLIVSDRFAVAVDSPLRRRAARLADELGLRMQTHLNEQQAEKSFVELSLYPEYASYTDVYRQDGLLARSPILAHCIHMTDAEWAILADTPSAAIAHCPTSNTLLGSGTMPLDELCARGLPYAICTDVGASPTVGLLAEMAQFLTVHAGRSRLATPSEALWRVTLGPARILGLTSQLGAFDVGKPLSFVRTDVVPTHADANSVIARDLLGLPSDFASNLVLDTHQRAGRLDNRVRQVVFGGKTVWERGAKNNRDETSA